MTNVVMEPRTDIWVECPEGEQSPSWARDAAQELARARRGGAVGAELVRFLAAVQGWKRPADVLYRFVLVSDLEQPGWVLDLALQGTGAAPTVAQVLSERPGLREKHVEEVLVGGRFPGVRVFDPVLVPDPYLATDRAAGSATEIQIAVFDFQFAVPDSTGGTYVVWASLTHPLVQELVAALPVVDELLATLRFVD